MYLETMKYGAARSYRSVDVTSRVEGASPHSLVMILFEELLKATDTMIAAMRRNDYSQRAVRQGRALAILLGLETSLDHEKGGELARDLTLVYRQARRLIMVGSRTNDIATVLKARDMLSEISTAWEEIAA